MKTSVKERRRFFKMAHGVISNTSFLDKDNFCPICSNKIDNKKLQSIIDDSFSKYPVPIEMSDPVIDSEDEIYCSGYCFGVSILRGGKK